MARLPALDIDQLTDQQRAVLDAINAGPRGGADPNIGLRGPFSVWVRSPTIGMPAQQLGTAARFDTSLSDQVREVAICVVGAFYRAKFEFAMHGPMAVAAGVDAAAVETIRRRGTPSLPADQAAGHDLAVQLVRDHRIDDATYRTAVDLLGENGVIELVTIIGYYCLVSLVLNAFEVPLQAGMNDPFPDADSPPHS